MIWKLFCKIWLTTVHFIFELINFYLPKKTVPPVPEGPLFMSAMQLAGGIREGKLTSRSVIEAFIRRIVLINRHFNMMVQDRFAAALLEADCVDAQIRAGSAPDKNEKPLLGVPFTLKDCIYVEGMKCTAGIVSRAPLCMPRDAAVVANMKRAGAICLGVTNVSEVGMWWEANNHVYGRTRNPYDSRRIVGGSSGGEGALIGAAGSVCGLGADIGGSIRMPAYFNGIFGHKPTKQIMSDDGTHPPCHGYQHDMHSVGPMCRYAADLAPLLEVLAGPNSAQLRLGEAVDLSNLKYYYIDCIKFDAMSEMDPQLTQAMNKVILHFQTKFGVNAERVRFPSVDSVLDLWTNDMKDAACLPFSQQMMDSKGDLNPVWELMKCSVGCSDHTAAAAVLAIYEKLQLYINPSDKGSAPSSKLIAKRKALEKDFAAILDDGGVLFFPSHPTLAPFHNQCLFQPFNFLYTPIFNSLALPTTQVPLGLGNNGMPLGVQVVSGLKNDRLCLAVACELEDAFGGWVCPGVYLPDRKCD